jgi:hypothetical protein
MSDLIIGSHLVTPRIGYQHHGLYVGNNQVVHFTSDNLIATVSLSDFTEGNGYKMKAFRSPFSRKEIVERAQSKLGKHHYNLMFQNCEHFVNWCIFNKPDSKQVRNAVANIGAGIASLASRNTAFTLLSSTPIVPVAITGYGVFKLVQWYNE